jgi:hypothetical protein
VPLSQTTIEAPLAKTPPGISPQAWGHQKGRVRENRRKKKAGTRGSGLKHKEANKSKPLFDRKRGFLKGFVDNTGVQTQTTNNLKSAPQM